MAETFQLTCPECGLQYQLDVAMIGAKVKCTECGVKFIAHDDPSPAVRVPVAKPVSTEPDEQPDLPGTPPDDVPEPGSTSSQQTPEAAESPVAQHVVQPTETTATEEKADAGPSETAQTGQPESGQQKTEAPKKSHGDPAAKAPTADQPKQRQRKRRSKKREDTGPPAETPPPKTESPQPQHKSAPAARHPDAKHFAAVENIAIAHREILSEVGKVIIGQRDVIDQVLTAFFARGNCLLKGVPGLAKTLLVNTLADSMALQFHRIQFTPDLMPTDITGTNILEEDPATGKRVFTFRKGPVFTNLLLADEINRTPPKTQAALLEAMQEKQVTSGEQLYQLPDPFLVLATQNPIEQEGTYSLPEAQLDRFIFMVNVGYPNESEELQILLETTRDREAKIEHVLDANGIIKIQEIVRSIPVTEHVAGYASRLVRATRPEDPTAPEFIKNWLHYGCGPRAGQSLLLAAKAHVAMNGRTVVACDDIRTYALPTLRHRLVLNFAAAAEGLTPDDVINKLLDHVKERQS